MADKRHDSETSCGCGGMKIGNEETWSPEIMQSICVEGWARCVLTIELHIISHNAPTVHRLRVHTPFLSSVDHLVVTEQSSNIQPASQSLLHSNVCIVKAAG